MSEHLMGEGKSRWQLALAVLAMIVSLVILVLVATSVVVAQEGEPEETPPPAKTPKAVSQPLIVPIFPRLEKKKDPSDDSGGEKLPEGADLRDSYVILEDGSVLSVADWIKGSITKNQVGAGMSDYQTRLFLGQVARALVGQGENQVNRSVATVGPPVPYKAPPVSPVLQAGEGLFRMFVPGRNGYTWDPATSGGGFNRRLATAGDAAILFEEQFQGAVGQTAADFQEIGTMMNMLNAYKKKHGID